MIIDNTKYLDDLLIFKPLSYYKFVILLREKDGKPLLNSRNKKEYIVKQWLVDSKEKLEEMLPDMITFAKLFGGRLYVTTDRKSISKTLFYMLDKITEYIKQLYNGNNMGVSAKHLNKIVSSASSSSECTHGDRKWLYDIDSKNKDTVDKVLKQIESMCVCIDSKNGYHIIADRVYDAHKEPLPENVELKDNSMALVYYNDEVIEKVRELLWIK